MNLCARSAARCLATAAGLGALCAVGQVRDITPPKGFVREVAAHPTDRGRLLALTSSGPQWSADGGRSWTVSASQPIAAERIFVHPGAPGTVFVQNALVLTRPLAGLEIYQGGQVFRSPDFGMTWTQLQPGYQVDGRLPISPFAARPGNPAHLFATQRTPGGCVLSFCNQVMRRVDETVLESLDAGATWKAAAAGLPPFPAGTSGFAGVDPIQPLFGAAGPTPASRELLTLVQPEALFVSFDAARTWRRNENPLLAGFEWVRPDPLRSHIYYALKGPKILRSDDGGTAWKEVLDVGRTDPGYVPELLVESGNSDRVWVGVTEKGVFFSDDRGGTWQNLGFAAVHAGHTGSVLFNVVSSIAISPAMPSTAYVVSSERLYEVTAPGDGSVAVTEFLDVAHGRYWLTANPGEALAIDYGNELSAARRTGAGFRAWPAALSPEMQPVCRFQGNPERGLHSRFLTMDAGECTTLAGQADWKLEAREDFYAFAPQSGGTCADGLMPLRRFFNAETDANHRYVTDGAIAQEMRIRGWVEEGTAMCVMPSR